MMKKLEGPEGPVRVLVEEPDRETPRPSAEGTLRQTQAAPEDLVPARAPLSRARAQPQEPSRKGEGASRELRDPEEWGQMWMEACYWLATSPDAPKTAYDWLR